MPKAKIALVESDTTPAKSKRLTPASAYAAECIKGREVAAALTAEILESGKTYLLGWRMDSMALDPRSGVQVGFAAYLAEKLVEGALLCENLHYCDDEGALASA